MKKWMFYLFPPGYAILGTLFCKCLFDSMSIAISPFGSTGAYPRFLPFCGITELVSLVLAALLLLCHLRYFSIYGYTKKALWLTVILTGIAALPLAMLWDRLFALLHVWF